MRMAGTLLAVVLLTCEGLSGTALAANTAPGPASTPGDPSVANTFPKPPVCLSYTQVKRELTRQGFSSISRRYSSGKTWVVRALHGGWRYEVSVDKCTGAIIGAARV